MTLARFHCLTSSKISSTPSTRFIFCLLRYALSLANLVALTFLSSCENPKSSPIIDRNPSPSRKIVGRPFDVSSSANFSPMVVFPDPDNPVIQIINVHLHITETFLLQRELPLARAIPIDLKSRQTSFAFPPMFFIQNTN